MPSFISARIDRLRQKFGSIPPFRQDKIVDIVEAGKLEQETDSTAVGYDKKSLATRLLPPLTAQSQEHDRIIGELFIALDRCVPLDKESDRSIARSTQQSDRLRGWVVFNNAVERNIFVRTLCNVVWFKYPQSRRGALFSLRVQWLPLTRNYIAAIDIRDALGLAYSIEAVRFQTTVEMAFQELRLEFEKQEEDIKNYASRDKLPFELISHTPSKVHPVPNARVAAEHRLSAAKKNASTRAPGAHSSVPLNAASHSTKRKDSGEQKGGVECDGKAKSVGPINGLQYTQLDDSQHDPRNTDAPKPCGRAEEHSNALSPWPMHQWNTANRGREYYDDDGLPQPVSPWDCTVGGESLLACSRLESHFGRETRSSPNESTFED